jgi:hypothetical protein
VKVRCFRTLLVSVLVSNSRAKVTGLDAIEDSNLKVTSSININLIGAILKGTGKKGKKGGFLKIFSRILLQGFKSSFEATLYLAKGLHNTLKLYGDYTVRELDRISGLRSGLKTISIVSQDYKLRLVYRGR